MSDPRRLRETADTFDRALLDAASDDHASAASEARALAALGLAATAVVGTAAVGSAAATASTHASLPPAASAVSKVATAVLVKWFGVGIVATVAVGSTVAYVDVPHYFAPAPISTNAASVVRAGTPTKSTRPASVRPTNEKIPEEVPADISAPALPEVVPPAPVPVAAPVAITMPTPVAALASPSTKSVASPARIAEPLSPEIELLDRARRALAVHDPDGAKQTLAEYKKRFPKGALGEEASVASIEALVQSGDTAGARSAANAFFAQNPGSAYERRVHVLLNRVSNP